MKLHFIILLSLLLQNIFGQNSQNCNIPIPKENTYIDTDRDKYISGENIWFKAYNFEENKLQSQYSKVLYIELFDGEKNVFIQKKYSLSQGTTNGVLEIPADLNSGNYFLRAYTQYQRNFTVENIFTKVISVLNPNGDSHEIKIDIIENQKSHDDLN